MLRPGGAYDSSPAIYRRGSEAHEARVPEGRPNTPLTQNRGSAFAKLNRFSREIAIVPPEREQFLNTSTGDKSPAYFLVVPPGHTATTLLSSHYSGLAPKCLG
jgi:hypothetical protein